MRWHTLAAHSLLFLSPSLSLSHNHFVVIVLGTETISLIFPIGCNFSSSYGVFEPRKNLHGKLFFSLIKPKTRKKEHSVNSMSHGASAFHLTQGTTNDWFINAVVLPLMLIILLMWIVSMWLRLEEKYRFICYSCYCCCCCFIFALNFIKRNYGWIIDFIWIFIDNYSYKFYYNLFCVFHHFWSILYVQTKWPLFCFYFCLNNRKYLIEYCCRMFCFCSHHCVATKAKLILRNWSLFWTNNNKIRIILNGATLLFSIGQTNKERRYRFCLCCFHLILRVKFHCSLSQWQEILGNFVSFIKKLYTETYCTI